MIIPKLIRESINLKDGRIITIETGQLAKQANGSALIRMHNTILLATVVKGEKKNIDFFPLTVDYREKYSAGGKIPGGFIKREIRPSNEEILITRFVDRVLRPLFPKKFRKEIQIMISLLSYEKNILPDGLAGLAASTALMLSRLPFKGPISEIRIIRIKKKLIINPGLEEIKKSDINLIIGASINSILMLEGEIKEVSEKDVFNIIKKAHFIIKLQIKAQIKLINKFSIFRKKKFKKKNIQFKKKFAIFSYNKIYKFFLKEKKNRIKKYINILNNFFFIKKKYFIINKYFEKLKKKIYFLILLKKKIRLDGRKYNEIRNFWCLVGYLPEVHGSVIFSRGETQSLTTVTLGSSLDINRINNPTLKLKEKFYLHYNFPSFSIGEVRKIQGLSRREIGHGNLAQMALKNIIPKNNPYTIRLISDIFESNGSSSMATVCAGSLALMDASIFIKNTVCGIAMGLIKNKKSKKYIILSDIIGEEDYMGNIDFKITGTLYGMTSVQMDVKIKKFTYNMLNNILEKSKKCRLKILKNMNKILSIPRKKIKYNAPKIYHFNIPKNFIKYIIGPGGKNIQKIQHKTNTFISIKEKKYFGFIEILGKNYEKIKKTLNFFNKIIFVPKIGKIYKANIKYIKNYSAFIEINKFVKGFILFSKREWKKLNKILKIGNFIKIKYLGIDNINEKMKFSINYYLYKKNLI